MKHDPKAITLTMDLYFKNVSLRKICDHLKQFYNLKVNPTTPMRWVKKYLKLLSQYSEQFKPDVSDVWHTDEMTVNIKKEGEKRYKEWIWNIMDSETRYLLACRVTKDRFIKDAVKPLKDAKDRANKRPRAIVTDGLQAYNKAIPSLFYKNDEVIRNPHLRLKDFETKPNNNIVERLNGTYRERLKVMRGLPDSENAEEFLEGLRVYYNYIRPHQSLNGLTPSEVANIPVDLSGNRWLKMIELAKLQDTS
jgi:transposase-like protein